MIRVNTKKNDKKTSKEATTRQRNYFKPKEIGVLINENNIVVNKIGIDARKDFFENKGNTYVLNRKKDFFLKLRGFLRDNYYYFYDVNHAIALSPNKMHKLRDYRAEDINTIMYSEALKILNSKKNNLFNIEPKYLIIAGLIIVVAILYFTGNLTPGQVAEQGILLGGLHYETK